MARGRLRSLHPAVWATSALCLLLVAGAAVSILTRSSIDLPEGLGPVPCASVWEDWRTANRRPEPASPAMRDLQAFLVERCHDSRRIRAVLGVGLGALGGVSAVLTMALATERTLKRE